MTNTALKEDEEIEASRAPLLDHLAELRNRLMTSLAVVVVGVIIAFIFVDHIFLFLAQPFQTAMAHTNPEHASEGIQHTFQVGRVLFLGNDVNQTRRPSRDRLELWKVDIAPNGALQLIGEDYGSFTLAMGVLSDEAHPEEPYGIIERIRQ